MTPGIAELPRSIIALLLLISAGFLIPALWLLGGAGADAMPAAVLGGAMGLILLAAVTKVCDLARRMIAQRDLRRARSILDSQPGAAFLVAGNGKVHAQNALSRTALGERGGQHVTDLLGLIHADVGQAMATINVQLKRNGFCTADLGSCGTYRVSRHRTGIQLWSCLDGAEIAQPRVDHISDDFDLLPVSLLMLDSRAAILRANAAARELLGDDTEGQSLAHFLDGLGREIGDWVSDICAGRLASASEVLHLRGRTDRFVQVNLTPGKQGCAIAVLSDASAMKTLEAQFVQSQKMQAIGQLAGGIAHDFNNLLTAITGHCDLLMLRHDKSHPDFADLDQISQNANRAAALVRQLLAFSRKQTLKPQILDLGDTLADLTHLLNRLVGERVYLTVDHDPRSRMIRADRRQLEQVIMNLVVNARDAMAAGGDIAIVTRNMRIDETTRIGQVNVPPGEYVRVQVRDQGCGIPAEELGKIFEPFYTTKRTGEGTGLGLSTAYGIVKQTGGYIFCDSVLGEGSTFSLFFPAHDRPQEQERPEARVVRAAVVRREADATVLLVEDEAPVRAFASRALKLQGIKVIEAASAEEALSLLSDRRLQVDMFVTDVVMPGMDGPAWVRAALCDRPDTRVIFMSGYAEDVFGEGHVPIPQSAFLAKPFSLSELTGLVRQQLQLAS